MLQTVAVSGIIVIAAIILFMFLCMKGMGSIPAGFICVVLVCLVAKGTVVSNLTGTFVDGLVANFGTFFFLFSMGCAFGGLLGACGGSDRLGYAFTRLLGQDNAMYVIFIISILLGLTGVAPCALVPFLAYGMLRATDLPRYIGMVAVASGTTISYTLVPGSLGTPNVLAGTILGEISGGKTSIYAAPAYSIILLVVTIILNCLYIRYLTKKARKNDEHYVPGRSAAMQVERRAEEDCLPLSATIIAIVIPIVFPMITILGFHWDTIPAALVGLTIAILYMVIGYKKYFKDSILGCIRTNVEGIQWNIVCAVVVCGFASVIQNTTFYETVLGKLMGSNMNPYVLAVIGALVCGGLCADFISGAAVFSSTIGAAIINMSATVNVQVMQRLALAACSVFDSLPHGGMVLLSLNMFDYNHKEAYKYYVMSNIVVPLCTTAVGLILAVTVFG